MPSMVKDIIIAILIVSLIATGNAEDCAPRDFGYGSVVCVCNSTFCDSASVDVPVKGQYRSYESGQSGKRMSQQTGRFVNGTADDNDIYRITLSLNPNVKFQKIHGFGGAFTDAAGINMKKISEAARDKIIETYFSVNGSRYSLARLPIGGTDFSTRTYTYDDNNDDVKLEKFRLANEDYQYKIPFMKKAIKFNPHLRFVSAAWSAPPWMKTNDNYVGFGLLKTEYYQAYADYIVKFLLEYKKQGLKVWAVSTGNEPADSYVPIVHFNTMAWTPRTMANWVADNLGPTIAKSGSNDTIILMLDDQRFNLPWYPIDVFNNTAAKNYIAGIAVHWYYDNLIRPSVLDVTHDLYPEKFLIMTEACLGSLPWDIPKVRLGDWKRGEQYILSIIENLNHWMTGWVDWNLVLDKQGGPNWVRNFVDSPIIVNPETDEFFKQPTYYALAHFSKFVIPGSTRIGLTDGGDVKTIAFLTPNNDIVIVLYNRNSDEKKVLVVDPEQGRISMQIPPLSIRTIIYKR